jgi:Predicted permeases
MLAMALIVWLITYNFIQPLADWFSYSAIGLGRDSRLGESVAFFLYDVPKILLLLSSMVFLISIVRTFFSPERTRALLGGKCEDVGNILAAMLGIVTLFCSCSAVPLFIGFVESGIPLGVTFSFLIAAPTINEVAIILLFGLFGWKVAGLYIASGLVVAIVAGFIIGRLKMERYVADLVWKAHGKAAAMEEKLTWADRVERAWESVKEIVGKVWLYVVIGIAIGDIHEKNILDIWNDDIYKALRKRLQDFDFSPCAFCNSCEMANENLEDCFGNVQPTCGGCLWARGLIRCP